MKITKKLLSVVTAVICAVNTYAMCLPITASAETYSEKMTYGLLNYQQVDEDEDGTYDYINISGCDTSATEVVIPAEIAGLPVKMIGFSAFYNYKKLENITIPDTVTKISGGAFENTLWLENKRTENPLVIVNNILIDGKACSGDVIVPDNVISIGQYAFKECNGLESITIPGNVETIGSNAFQKCFNLRKVNLSAGLKEIDHGAFYYCTSLESIEIPDTVTFCGNYSFMNCRSLKNIKLSSNIESISDSMFEDCVNLESIEIPENVKYIEKNAFAKCISLKKVTMHENINYIYNNAFNLCLNLTEINAPASVKNNLINRFSNYTDKAKYTYEIYVLSDASRKFYNDIPVLLYIKTDNPDPEGFKLDVNTGYIAVRRYDDVRSDIDIDGSSYEKVDGGYVVTFMAALPGDYSAFIFENNSDENTFVVGGVYNFTVYDYDEDCNKWMDEVIESVTTEESMTNIEIMSAVARYMKENGKYYPNVITDGKMDVLYLASMPTEPAFVTHRWDSLSSPAYLYEFALRIGGFDRVHRNYTEYGMNYEIGHPFCFCEVGEERLAYNVCRESETGRLDEIPTIDFTDESQLFVPESIKKSSITVSATAPPVIIEPVVTTTTTTTTITTTTTTTLQSQTTISEDTTNISEIETVATSEMTTVPETTVTETIPVVTAPTVKGDINGDGTVTIEDAFMLRDWLTTGNYEYVECGDVNGDFAVDIRDLIELCKIISENTDNSYDDIYNEVFNQTTTVTTSKTETTTTVTTKGNNNNNVLLGDANDDGYLNVRDCAAIAKALAKGNVGMLPPYADYDANGIINVRDAAALARELARKS